MHTQPSNAFAAPACARRSRRGVALVIILAFVVMLSGLVIAFFSRAMTERQVSNSTANRNKVEMLARGAIDQIVGDLMQEITDGSAVSPSGTGSIYLPNSAADMAPRLAGSSGTGGSENLVKRSASGVQFSPGANGRTRAANVSSLTPSLNNRAVTASQWNKPLLLPTPNTSVTNLTPSGAFNAPDWILIARDGSNPTGWSASLITSPANSGTSVFGRYAYNVYDQGGLLDINAIGHPFTGGGTPPYTSTNSDPEAAYKGVLAFADLTQLPGFSGSGGNALSAYNSKMVINNLVGWRNFASLGMPAQRMWGAAFSNFTMATAKNYTQLVRNNTTGFLSPMKLSGSSNNLPGQQTDQMFATRQQLLKFLTQAIFNLGTQTGLDNTLKLRAAIPYLTHFSRELNSPSWGPSQDAQSMGGNNGTGSPAPYAYKTNQNNPAVANRFLPKVAVKGGFTRTNGTAAQSGEPLIKSRFPLSRLAGLGPSGIVTTGNTTMLNGTLSPANTTTVQRDFGLAWNPGSQCWDYVGHSGTTLQASIKTLDEVASENREPNFFELLKAGILSGSLGVDGGSPTATGGSQKIPTLHEQDKDLQILQIGANLIDQFDGNSYPTAVRIDRSGVAWEAVGIEHLPYLSQYKPIAGQSSEDPTKVATYFLFKLWNPHRVTTALPLPTTDRPDIRVGIQGSLKVLIAGQSPDGEYNPSSKHVTHLLPVSTVQLTNNARDKNYLTPNILTAGDVVGLGGPTDTMKWVPAPAALGGFAAFRIPDYDPVFSWPPRSDSPYNRRANSTLAVTYSADALNRFQVMLEYKDPSGAWRAYSYAHGINDPSLTWRTSHESWVANGTPNTSTTPYSPKAFGAAALDLGHTHVSVDPRARRFIWTMFGAGKFPGLFGGSLWPTTDTSGYGSPTMQSIQLNATKIWPTGSSIYPALLSRNNSGTSKYADADGVTRLGDSGNFTSDASSGNPFSVDADRPIILNRPFRSVAEMGYASRDMPFRSLDFFTDKSPDAALLELFAVSESPTSMRAGVFNLNTRQAPVLQAVLSGALKDVTTAGTNLSSSDAANVAANLASSAATSPLTNPAQIVERISAISTLGNRKSDRETIVRALAGIGQTRTWNLMIDVVAQTGRYPQTATKLEEFLVEGERRYWAHIAIDRLTGQVIDSQLEPVQE